jgi:DNA-binding protein HU-beta
MGAVGDDRGRGPSIKERFVNKAELIAAVANAAGTTNKDAEGVLNSFRDLVQAAVRKGDDVAYPGLGKFSQAARKARTARNPRTGETLKVPASKAPKFTAAAELKRVVNGTEAAPKIKY